jgi:hypothetical protein
MDRRRAVRRGVVNGAGFIAEKTALTVIVVWIRTGGKSAEYRWEMTLLMDGVPNA